MRCLLSGTTYRLRAFTARISGEVVNVLLRRCGPDLVFGKLQLIPSALRQIGQSLWRMFKRSNNKAVYEPDTQRLAELVSRVAGASWCWCGGCGELLAPVVVDDDYTCVVALGCRNCGPTSSIPVCAGRLMGGEPAATIH